MNPSNQRACKYCKIPISGVRKLTCLGCAPLRLAENRDNETQRKKRIAKIAEKSRTVSYSELCEIMRANGMMNAV